MLRLRMESSLKPSTYCRSISKAMFTICHVSLSVLKLVLTEKKNEDFAAAEVAAQIK